MAWKPIQNITLLANEGDTVELPRQVPSVDIDSDGNIHNTILVNIDYWKDINDNRVTVADTTKSRELMYYGIVLGYPHTVYCSVVVGDSNENPESEFPKDFKDVKNTDKPDEFGISKEEVRTSDMPNITDYQYFKAKKNRTSFESAQLQKLTELMASKIIMARDINHLRNAITNTQLFCLSLKRGLDETITDGENIGGGEGEVYSGLVDNDDKFGKKMQFRTLKAGENVTINTMGDEIEISAEGGSSGGEMSSDMCALNPIKAKSYGTCTTTYDGQRLDEQNGAYYKFADFLGFKVAKATRRFESMMIVFGSGDGEQKQMTNAGRIYKGIRDLIIEMKVGNGKYAGIRIKGNYEGSPESGEIEIYGTKVTHSTNTSYSRIASAMINLNANEPNYNDTNVYGSNSACGRGI